MMQGDKVDVEDVLGHMFWGAFVGSLLNGFTGALAAVAIVGAVHAVFAVGRMHL